MIFILYCSRLFVTLEEIAGFLCIKAMQRIGKFLCYDLETVLNYYRPLIVRLVIIVHYHLFVRFYRPFCVRHFTNVYISFF